MLSLQNSFLNDLIHDDLDGHPGLLADVDQPVRPDLECEPGRHVRRQFQHIDIFGWSVFLDPIGGPSSGGQSKNIHCSSYLILCFSVGEQFLGCLLCQSLLQNITYIYVHAVNWRIVVINIHLQDLCSLQDKCFCDDCMAKSISVRECGGRPVHTNDHRLLWT